MSKPNIRFAGQITGCEGYVESAAVGIFAARSAAAELRGERLPPPPVETALGALLGHITGGANADTFQPMNVNFGLMPPLPERFRKADRKQAYTDRARSKFIEWLASVPPCGAAVGRGTMQAERSMVEG
jgi:methylenetetrahydrofolate--tRNA-(uracil-5-)-methyltransferase